MREIYSRLRALLSPQVLAILGVVMALLAFADRGSAARDLEERIARTLSCMDGAGRVEVAIRMKEMEGADRSGSMMKKGQSVPCGAVAVAQGADDPLVSLQLQEALCALLGLSPSAVCVITGGN